MKAKMGPNSEKKGGEKKKKERGENSFAGHNLCTILFTHLLDKLGPVEDRGRGGGKIKKKEKKGSSSRLPRLISKTWGPSYEELANLKKEKGKKKKKKKEKKRARAFARLIVTRIRSNPNKGKGSAKRRKKKKKETKKKGDSSRVSV